MITVEIEKSVFVVFKIDSGCQVRKKVSEVLACIKNYNQDIYDKLKPWSSAIHCDRISMFLSEIFLGDKEAEEEIRFTLYERYVPYAKGLRAHLMNWVEKEVLVS